MATRRLIYLCTCDVLANDPASHSGPPQKFLGAFNLVSVAEDSAAGAPTSTDEMLFPWGKPTGNVPPAIGADFVLLTFSKPAAPAKTKGDAVLPLKTVSPHAINNALAGQMEAQFSKGANAVMVLKNGGAPEVGEDHTWSATLAGASQQGYPIAHSLALSYWLAGENNQLPDLGGKWAVILPKTFFGLPLLDDTITISPGASGSAEVQAEATYKGANGGPGVRLRVDAFTIDAQHPPAFSQAFVGQGQRIHAATFTNWLGTLPQKLGEFLDWVWILRTSDWSSGTFGKDNVPTVTIFRDTSAMRKQKIALASLPMAGAALSLAASMKAIALEAPIRRYVIEPMLLLFHDHADLGLRRPFYDRENIGTSEQSGGAGISESLAMDLLGHLARSVPGASPDVNEEIRAALSELADAPPPVMYPDVGDVSGEVPKLVQWTTNILMPALDQIDKGDDNQSHSGLYANLREVLEFEAQLRPLWGTEKGEDLSSNNGDQQSIDRTRKILAEAWEELSRLQEDENALLLLFCRQWDSLLNGLRKGRFPQYKKWISLLGFEDNRKEGSDPEAAPLPILNGRLRESLRDFLQQTNTRLSQRYADGLTGTLIRTKDSPLQTALIEKLETLSDPNSQEGAVFRSLIEKLVKGEVLPLAEAPTNQANGRIDFAKVLVNLATHSASLDPDPSGKMTLDEASKRAIRCQHFQAAAYAGKALSIYLELRSQFRPSPLLAPAFTRPQGQNRPMEIPPDACKLMIQAISLGSFVQEDPESSFWKQFSWASHLIGLNRATAYLPTPPPLPVPLVASAAEYDPTRYSGILVLARRRRGNEETPWWLVNVGEAVVGNLAKTPSQGANVPLLPIRKGASNELTDVQSDEVKMKEWLTNGQLVRFPDSPVVPAPWQVAESFGLTQSVVEFRGRPIGVKLWDDAADDPLANAEIASGGRSSSFTSPIKIVRYQIIDPEVGHLGWGPVPGLRYHKDWQYQFLFAPIHNTGALPSRLRKDLASPGHLGTREQMALPAENQSPIIGHVVTVTNYVRRVPVQQIRLAREFTPHQLGLLKGLANRLDTLKDQWAAGHNLPQKDLDALELDLKSLVFQDFQPPAIAAGVRPLYADLQDEETYRYIESLKPRKEGEIAQKKAPPLALPSQTILLQRLPKANAPEPNGNRSRSISGPEVLPADKGLAAPVDHVRFAIRPPATTIENWTIWQSSQIDEALGGPDVPAIMDCIADMNRLVRESSADTNSSIAKAVGLEIPQLIDDPAVVGVVVRVRMILNLTGRTDAEPATTEMLKFVSFEKQDLKSYPAKADPPWIDGDKLDELVAQLCRQQVQTATKDTMNQGWTLDVRLGQSKLDFTENGVVTVPEGCVTEIATVPCIKRSDHENSARFGIYRTRDDANPDAEFHLETYPDSLGAGDVYGVRPAIYRIWVEGVPSPEPSEDLTRMLLPGPGYLPTPRDVWNALRLASVGTHGREARDISRLEIAVLPSFESTAFASETLPDLLRKWCFVSEVHAEIQPWVWRGLPEDKYDSLSLLIPQADAPNGVLDRDMSPAILQKLVEGEAPAFGEREDAAARVQQGLVNYAAASKLWRDKVERSVPPFIVYQDTGEQDEVPRYYRVKLVIKSRYAGLGTGADANRTQQIHATPVSSEYAWSWSPPENSDFKPAHLQRTSSHRRILFRGQLRRKLDLPRVKMVIPVLDALLDEKTADTSGKPGSSKHPNATRPGFIVLTREPLRSPWHRLIADVDWARVNVGGAADAEVIKELPEFGPDPITSENSFDWAFRAKSDLRAQSEMDGRAFGLTYEREADAAFFPNAGFYFNPPFQKHGGAAGASDGKAEDHGPTGSDVSHDWFAKVRFRWEIRPSHVMDNMAGTLVSESTQPWQVRLLAPFRWIGFEKKEADLESVTFAISSNGPRFFETIHEGSSVKSVPLLAPLGPKYPQNNREPEASPMAILLFVAWSLVPDFLNAERSKIAHSIYAFHDKSTFPVYRNDLLEKASATDTRGGRPKVGPDGGNFLLIFGRSGDLNALLDKIKKIKLGSDGDAGLNILVDEFLFPKDQGRLRMEDQDARAMITRCSPPIFVSQMRASVP